MIDFQHVSKRYKGAEQCAVADATFQVKDGEFVFLVGPSGSGKTTIFKLITREEPLTEGHIQVNDFDLNRLKHRKAPFYRRTLGVVFQDFRLIQTKTVAENLAFVMQVINIDPYFIDDRVDEVLTWVNMADKKHRYPHELSGGEQQRVSIARALMNRPAVILADEPTGNLDPELSRETLQLFDRVNRELKTTVLVVTHERALVDEMNKRVLYLDRGRIVGDREQGTYDITGTKGRR
ncbi:MAG: ATP-binding cassette domain-containing protein [Clostridiales bacterium]|nr:ATP-binding cassette domain-containing protein [Clostridiales bacterium]